MTNIKTHSTLNTTNPTPTASNNDTRHNTTPSHTRITATTNKSPTTHTLKTLCQHTTVIRYHTIHIQITTTMHIPKNISSPKQPLPIKHPQSRQNLKLHLSNIYFHHLDTCLSTFTLSPIAPIMFPNSTYSWILLDSVEKFSTTRSYPLPKSGGLFNKNK